MEKNKKHTQITEPMPGAERFKEEIIPVVHEQAIIRKEIIETGKVRIRKRVTEETTAVALPIINESYQIDHVPVASKTLDTPPPAVRYEGDKMIVSVVKEITVVQKKYEVIEEIHITRKLTETPLVQEITLRKERVDIERISDNTVE